MLIVPLCISAISFGLHSLPLLFFFFTFFDKGQSLVNFSFLLDNRMHCHFLITALLFMYLGLIIIFCPHIEYYIPAYAYFLWSFDLLRCQFSIHCLSFFYDLYTQCGAWAHNPEIKSHILLTEAARCLHYLSFIVNKSSLFKKILLFIWGETWAEGGAELNRESHQVQSMV